MSDIRKIHIDTKDDYKFVQKQLQDAAKSALATEDLSNFNERQVQEMEEYLAWWIESTFERAEPNFLVNGLPFRDIFAVAKHYEAFDKQLFNEVLQADTLKRETMDRVIALRKLVPQRVEESILEGGTIDELCETDASGGLNPTVTDSPEVSLQEKGLYKDCLELVDILKRSTYNPHQELRDLIQLHDQAKSEQATAEETAQLIHDQNFPSVSEGSLPKEKILRLLNSLQ